MLTIGEFSKMTYLSVKALRHYHEVGLLAPADIDASTGYRRYASSQVPTAQAIRRFRELDMPIDDVRRVLEATDLAQRNRVIVDHLERMREQLERTQMSVASLQALLESRPSTHREIEMRGIPAMHVLAIQDVVEFDTSGAWLVRALSDLDGQLSSAGVERAGPDGALFSEQFFQAGSGEVIAFVPVEPHGNRLHGDVIELPATNVAVLVHDGPFADADQTYGALGTAVAERGIGAPGPIREHYLDASTIEVCWPVTIGTVTSRP